jgi:carboxymethylenebutenolidase
MNSQFSEAFERPFVPEYLGRMGTTIEFPTTSGTKTTGYLADGGTGAPGVIVIQEWWGLVPQIEATCDRFAAAGLTALAPDLYDGRKVPVSEPDEAAKEMMNLQVAAAAADLSGAVDELLERTGRDQVGVVGYCMGGGLALLLGATRPDAVGAVVPCYGVHPWSEGQPDYAAMRAATQIHCAGLDTSFPPSAAEALAITLRGLGRDVELFVYEGVNHAFANEDRPEVYDATAATLMFDRTVAFLGQHLA